MASGLPADCDRAWDGLIYYKKGTFVARYEPFWGVVRRESSRGLQRIDLFRPLSAVHSTSDLFIPLHDVLHVLNRDARARKFAFQVLATGCKYHLATETAEDREMWVQGLKRLLFGPPQSGVVYEHQVIVIPNSHSEKLQLSGRYILRITDSHTALFTSTGTLPTRFLYSLSDIAHTHYTNFTDAGQKFSVLVLYCRGNVSTDYSPVQHMRKSSSSSSVGNGSVGREEGMFVFQTQSASSISRTIEHRARVLSRKDGQSKPTALGNSSTVTTQTSSIPMSCPPLPHFSDEKLRDSRVSKLAEKPRPPPRPVRTSVIATDMDSQEHSALYLTYVQEGTGGSTIPVKPKKAPIPLPRHKKYSLDSSSQRRVYAATSIQPPVAKPRQYPPRPKLHGLCSLDLQSPANLANVGSMTSTSSLPILDTETTSMEGITVDRQTSAGEKVMAEPTYMNLTSFSLDYPGEDDTLEKSKDTEEEDKESFEAGHVENGATESLSEAVQSHVTYYNLHPSRSYDNALTIEDDQTTVKNERYKSLVPSKSCDMLTPPTLKEATIREAAQNQQQPKELPEENEPGTDSLSSTESAEEAEEESSPSLDEMLAKILQRRRESRDINKGCDNETRTQDHGKGKPLLNRTRSNEPRIMVGQDHISSPQTPHYPPLLRSKGFTVDEEDEGSGDRGGLEEKRRSMLSWGDSVSEREDRSEWLRRGSSVQEWMPLTRTDGDSGEDEDHYTTYLKILPSTAQSLPHSPHRSVGVADGNSSKFSANSPLPEEHQSDSTPDSGSPLWGTNRACSRQSSAPSPLAQGETHPPPSPTMQGAHAISECHERILTSPVPRRKKRFGSHRKSQIRGTLSRSRRLSSKESIEGDWLLRRRNSRPKPVAGEGTIRTGPLPSVPMTSLDIDSDYEWAEIGEALSDTGSDYIYTTPLDLDLAPLGLDTYPRRSASCTELAPHFSSTAGNVERFSISERPPAPLPISHQDPVLEYNPAHIETPVSTPKRSVKEKRSTFQRSRSVDNCLSVSGIYEDLESQVDYDYIKQMEGDYDYAAVPNRSAASLFPREKGEYVDINRNSPPKIPSSASSSSSSSPAHYPAHYPTHTKMPVLPPRQHPSPPPRHLASLPITDV